MKTLIITIILSLAMLNANAFWVSNTYSVAQLEKPIYVKAPEPLKQKPLKKKEKALNYEMNECFKRCSIDTDLLRQCRAHATTPKAKVKCINFSKRECLMRCKEQEFKKNTISLLN